MKKRTKKGYLWAFEQQDLWEDIAEEKNSQLDNILNLHLDWFESHKTVDDLINYKKPHFDSKKNANSNEIQQQDIELNICFEKESSIILENEAVVEPEIMETDTTESEIIKTIDNQREESEIIKTMDSQQESEIIKNMDNQQQESKVIKNMDNQQQGSEINKNIDLDSQQDSEINKKMNNQQEESEIKSDQSVISVSTPKNIIVETNGIDNKKDQEDEEDEIQLVVSTRSMEKSPEEKKSPSATFNFAKPLPRQHSTFMSRLFKLARPLNNNNNKEDSPTTLSKEDSPTTLSKEDSPASSSVVTTKRPSNHLEQAQQEIVVSDFEPERPFKFPKTKKDKQVKVSKPLDEKPKQKEEKEEEDFKIPSWAVSPELQVYLKKQSELDPDRIFGRLQPLHMEDIFPPSRV